MNGIVYNPAETEPDIRCMSTETVAFEDLYSTTPLIRMRSIYRQPNEEELHSSFEEAISDRVLAVNKQLKRLSIPLADSLPVLAPPYASIQPLSLREHYGILKYATRQVMFSMAIAFMLIMVGFDLMGLLVLNMR